METSIDGVFKVELRLLSGYYGRLGGLSDIAFRRYVLMLESAWRYRKNEPIIVYNSFRDMRRRGGLTNDMRNDYDLAAKELSDKGFIYPRPEYATGNTRDANEILILPDYDGANYSRIDYKHTAENMKMLGRGYIEVPADLAIIEKGNIFRRVIQDCTLEEPSILWAIVIKLYQYNNITVRAAIDPVIMRKDADGVFINPVVYMELGISLELLVQCLEELCLYGILGWCPINHCATDFVEVDRVQNLQNSFGSFSVARLLYQPPKPEPGRLSYVDDEFLHDEFSPYNL